MKRHRFLPLVFGLCSVVGATVSRPTVAAPADCETQCQRDYERCSARGLDSTACLSRLEACLASC